MGEEHATIAVALKGRTDIEFIDIQGDWMALPIVYPGIAKLPVVEVRERGGDLLVSACPTARRMFQKADPTLESVTVPLDRGLEVTVVLR